MTIFYTLDQDEKLTKTNGLKVEQLSISKIVSAYNKMAASLDENLVKRFSTKPVGIKRLNQISQRYAISNPQKKSSESKIKSRTATPYPTKDGYVPDAESLAPSRVTRANPYAGLTIYDATGGANPRREICQETKAPARAWLCFNIIIDSGVKGVLFEDYITAGGNLRDLHHDHKLERVVIK